MELEEIIRLLQTTIPMSTGIISALLLAYNLLYAGYALESTSSIPPERTLTTGASLEAIISQGDDKIDVSIEYQIQKRPGASTISYSGLEAFDTKVTNIEAIFSSTRISLTPDVDHLKIAGQIRLPEPLVQDSLITLVIRYQLMNARQYVDQEFGINIPVLWIENSEYPAEQGIFEAHLVMPEGYYIHESFPANAGRCSSNSNPRHSCLTIQAVPTFLRFRGLIGENPTFTVLKILDYSILTLLALTCIAIGLRLMNSYVRPALSV